MSADEHDQGDAEADDEADDTIVDPRDVFKLLLADNESERDALLERYATKGPVEIDIVNELADTRVLADVEGFEPAHRFAMHAIEVLNRNGRRQPRMRKLPVVKPLAKFLVGLVLGFIMRSYRNSLTNDIQHMYDRRYAAAIPGTPERGLLLRARRDIMVVREGFSGSGAGVPTFLVGGALVSTVFATLESFLLSVFHNAIGVSIVGIVGVLLLVLLAWSAMFAAGVARRRIRLTTQLPAERLWQVVGCNGNPPHDQSFLFALIAIVLAILSWTLVPVVAYMILS